MQLKQYKEIGLSLIELLIGILISLVLVGALTATFVSVSSTHVNQDKVTALEEELAAVMDLMVREISRAGYAREAIDGTYAITLSGSVATGFTENPYQNMAVGAATGALTSNAALSGACVVFFYDENQDDINTALSSSSDNFGGFKIDNNVVSRRSTLSTTVADDTKWYKCDEPNEWEAITSNWAISDLTGFFELDVLSTVGPLATVVSDVLYLQPRNVNITLTASRGDTSPPISRTVTETVHIRNHRVYLSGP